MTSAWLGNSKDYYEVLGITNGTLLISGAIAGGINGKLAFIILALVEKLA